MSPDWIDAAARATAYVVGGGIFANQLDELHMDAQYLARGLHRERARALSPEDLRDQDKRIAIVIPAWKEAEVIESMLEHNLATLDYDRARYHFFCGTYPNDPETQARVDAVARRAPNVHKVVVPHDGPTSKADCLNHVYQAIVAEEQRRGERFDVLLMHDAEDVIHPSSLRLYAHLVPKYEMVQTPVFSLPVPTKALVAGTYVDEFAEHHLKDMLVREAIGGLVPSAGVGTAFARDAFDAIAGAQEGRPFDVESLTEDYAIGVAFRLANRRVHFACRTLPRGGDAARAEYVATREYFPGGFRASIRQRSRWILGITLQTWARVGWKGSLPVLYCLWRDRKAVVTNALLLFAYALVLYVAAREALAAWTHAPWSVARLAPARSWLAALLAANLALAGWRATAKAVLVGRLYGLRHALVSAPRLVLANVISIAATARAIGQYTRHRITGAPLRWLKTTHAFLGAAAMAPARRLGEMLIDEGAIAARDLDEALALQRRAALPLGQILIACGAVAETRVLDAVARQHGLRVAELDAARAPLARLRALPEEDATSLGVLPIGEDDGRVVVAAAAPLARDAVARLESTLGAPVVVALADAAAIERTRARAYRLLARAHDEPTPRARLGDELLRHGEITAEALREALAEHARTGDPLGEVLLRRRAASPDAIAEALSDRGVAFRHVAAEEADTAAIARLGVAFCELYLIVPLVRADPLAARVVASASPMHPAVKERVEARLGARVEGVLAPTLSLRVALAVARTSPRLHDEGGDGAEIAALRAVLGDAIDLDALARDARAAMRSPIDHLESTGRAPALAAARARAIALGVPLAEDVAGDDDATSILPAAIARAHGVRVRAAEGGALVLAAPRPAPSLARAVTSVLPRVTVSWEVLAPREEPHDAHQLS